MIDMLDSKASLNKFLKACFSLGLKVESIDDLRNPQTLWGILEQVDSHVIETVPRPSDDDISKPDSLALLLSRLHDVADEKCSEHIQLLLSRCREIARTEELRSDDLVALAEITVVLAVESPNADRYIQEILTLPEEDQLSLQQLIQVYSSGFTTAGSLVELSSDYAPLQKRSSSDSMVSSHASQTFEKEYSSDIALQSSSPEDRAAPHSNTKYSAGGAIVPPLKFSHLGHGPASQSDELAVSGIKGEMKSQSSRELSVDVGEIGGRFASRALIEADEASIWSHKYGQLKAEHRKTETLKDEIQIKYENLLREHHATIAELAKVKESTKAATTATHSSMVDTMETLEMEAGRWKLKFEELGKERKEAEKKLQSEIAALKDEVQLLSRESDRAQKLEQSIEKYKLKIDEITMLKARNQELENTIANYLQEKLDAEEAGRNALELKRSLDSYKDRCAQLESDLTTLTAQRDSLLSQADSLSVRVQELEPKCQSLEQELSKVVEEYQAQLIEASHKAASPDDLSSVGNFFDLKEKYARLERENETLRRRMPLSEAVRGEQEALSPVRDRIAELENKLDDAMRLKDHLEGQYKIALSKLSVLELQRRIPGAAGESESFRLEMANKEKDEIRYKSQIAHLETQLESAQESLNQEKSRWTLQEESLRARLENQYEALIATLKEQLQLRDQELTFYKLSREEQMAVQRREERLMSAAMHNLGYRLFQLQTEKEKKINEYEALIMTLKSKSGAQLQTEGGAPLTLDSSNFF